MTRLYYFKHFAIAYIFIYALLNCQIAIAQEESISYQVSPSYQLTPPSQSEGKWLTPKQISPNGDNVFIANNHGQFFQIINKVQKPQSFLNLSALFPAQKQLTLTAFTLHPSFLDSDKTGAGILYTAHIEYIQGDAPITLTDVSAPQDLEISYHAVITEWQLGHENNIYHQAGQPREILRIALPDSHQGITQLGFNPHLKTWNTDFALLHAVLPSDKAFGEIPLYSGSVLRINPARFGLKHYTVPTNNPFLKMHKILDEIIMLGARNIQQISWTKHDEKKIIVANIASHKAQVIYGKVGSNWLQKAPTKILWTQDSYSNTLAMSLFTINDLEYIDVLHKAKNKWQLSALNLSQLNKNIEIKNWPIEPKIAASQARLTLIDNTPEQASLYNLETQKVFTLKPIAKAPLKTETEDKPKSSIDYIFILFVLIAVAIAFTMGFILYWVYHKYNGENIKPILRKNLADFDCINTTITLYKRREVTPTHTLNIKDIISCDISLNNSPILSLNTDTLFNNEKKKALLSTFALEQQHKMTSLKVRKVIMLLTDINKKTYSVCVYLRKGDQRYSKVNYQLAQTKLIEWAQLYSKVHQVTSKPN